MLIGDTSVRETVHIWLVLLLALLAACASVTTPLTQPAEPEKAAVESMMVVEEIVINNNTAVYTIDADGSNLTPLTEHTPNTYVAGWSPDGPQPAFNRALPFTPGTEVPDDMEEIGN